MRASEAWSSKICSSNEAKVKRCPTLLGSEDALLND